MEIRTNKGKHVGFDAAAEHYRHLKKLIYDFRKKSRRLFAQERDEDPLFGIDVLMAELAQSLSKDDPSRYENILLEIEYHLKQV